VNSIRAAGLVPYEESAVICLRVDKTAGKKVRHWREGWHREEEPGPTGKG
jgi:hypothetical protein